MGIYIHKASDHSFSRGDGAAGPAKSISFNPTPSGLEADNVQDAVDEVVDALDGKQDALTNPLTQSDVVNNLTSTATNVPLSAAQGKALNDKLTGALSVVSSAEVTYNTGVAPLNNVEKVICTRYSNGCIVISGVIHVTSAYVASSSLFTIPEGYRAPYSQAQKWVALYNTYGDQNFTCRMGGDGAQLLPWGAHYNYDTLKDAEWVVYISY